MICHSKGSETGFRAAVAALVLGLMLAAPAWPQAASLKLPPSKRVKLPNGMALILVERHTVPMVSFHLALRAGAVADPPGREGSAGLTAALLRKGTKTRTADKFSEELDFIGGTFDTFAGPDATTITSEFPKKDLAAGLDLFSDALMNPVFPAEEVTKLVRQWADGIRAWKDQPQAVIEIFFNGYLFGKHPYGRPNGGDEKSLATMTRDDIANFYGTNYAPGNAILVVAGDFSTTDMEKLLTAKFTAWPAGKITTVNLPAPVPFQGKKLLLIDKPDATQTFFTIGNVGVARSNPDRVALRVVNTLFGGRFTSMLNSELRIKTGLTYGARSAFDERRVPGPFYIATYTRNATTEKAMDMALDVLKRLHEKGITAEELASAKTYIKGQFPPTIETADQIAAQLAALELYGLDEREINDLYATIDRMTLDDARRVIHQYYPLDNLVFVLIGKVSEVSGVVAKYAPRMDRRSISDPGFESEAAPATRAPR